MPHPAALLVSVYLVDQDETIADQPDFELRATVETTASGVPFIMVRGERVTLRPGVYPRTVWGSYALRRYDLALIAD